MRILCVLFLFPGFAFGQLQTGLINNLEQLVNNQFVNSTVTISNVSYTGSPEAISFFTAYNTMLPIESGILLSTGRAYFGVNGPQGPNSAAGTSTDWHRPGDTMLSSVGASATYDAAVLEFDVVPAGDTFRLSYCFGSEEYPEYVNSFYSDVFAIFISGPGIQNIANIALVPNSMTPISVNNVNNGPSNDGYAATFPAYYLYNGTGENGPYNGSDYYLQYDGFTVALEAKHAVIPGESYHVRIAIADGADGIYDSGVFLRTQSLVTGMGESASYKPLLFPNPASDQLTIRSETPVSFVEIFTMDGKAIHQEEFQNVAEAQLHIAELPAGFYLLQIHSANGSETLKFRKL